VQGPEAEETPGDQHPWWQVMCLTGVDYFSTLSYLPAIAALAAGTLSPVATLLIVLLTLSSADATAHIVENPFTPAFLTDQRVPITLFLLAVLGAVFLAGFSEAVSIAIPLVAAYLALNAVVVAAGLAQVLGHPERLQSWREALTAGHGRPGGMLEPPCSPSRCWCWGCRASRPAVSMMPLVKVEGGDERERLAARIANTRRLLTVAAAIMSVYLLATTFVTTVLIPRPSSRLAGRPAGGPWPSWPMSTWARASAPSTTSARS
jgi:hypothetical protein